MTLQDKLTQLRIAAQAAYVRGYKWGKQTRETLETPTHSTVYTDPSDLTRVGDRAAHQRGFIDGFAGNVPLHGLAGEL